MMTVREFKQLYSHYRLCDQILQHLSKSNNLNTHIKGFKELSDAEIKQALDILVEDGFVKRSNSIDTFIVSLKGQGKIFINSGGYYNKLNNEISENERLSRLERQQRFLNKITLWLTVAIAVSAVFAAANDVIDILEKLNWIDVPH